MILHNEFKPFSKLVYDDDDDDENVSTYRILGSLEILAIKNYGSVKLNSNFPWLSITSGVKISQRVIWLPAVG